MMRRLIIGTSAALIAALAGCGDGPDSGNRIELPDPQAVQNRIETMPEGQRNAVFVRAVQDARQPCQHVDSSERAGEYRGSPVWTARCNDGGTWTIVIGNGGIAQILNAAEARLVVDGDNAAAAVNQQAE